jgi:hypothetical protein
MTEIICPMCSKPNPDHLEVCQFCQARLQPLIAPSPSDESAPRHSSEETSPTDNTPGDESQLPDWLDSLREEDKTEHTEAIPEGTSLDDESESLDWLDRIQGESDPEELLPIADESGDQEDGDDWLERVRNIQRLDESEGLEPPPAQAEDGEDILDRIQAFRSGDEETPELKPEDDEDVIDRLTSLPFDDTEQPGEAEPSPEIEGELSDWLTDLQQEDPSEDSESIELPIEEDLPDWLSSEVEDEPTPLQPSEATPEPSEESLPDWLSDVHHQEETPQAPFGEVDIPDWLSEPDQEEKAPADEPADTAPTPEEEIPSWISNLGEVEEPTPASPEPADIDQPEPDLDPELFPDWLKQLEVSSPEVDGEVEPPPDEIEDELVGSPLVPEDMEFEDDILSADQELPAWLVEEPSEETISEKATPLTGEEDTDLTPADLPGWLAAMRPVETPLTQPVDVEEGQVESAGPLAGLSNVLSAEPEIARLKKPPAYKIKLQISESQQAHAKLVNDLIKAEGRSQPIPRDKFFSTQRVLRWVIAMVLIAVIGLVVIMGTQQVPLPDPTTIPAEVLDTSRQISNLSAGAPVVVAFDYEPGLAGEMDAAAAGVVDHLMIKGARLTLVSTSPTGPALAERFLSTVQGDHNYISGKQYINLGYIPGGTSGLLAFVEAPQRITPLSFDGMEAWGTLPLQGVNALSDFALALIITDNPDTARAWIEQVQPRLGNTPMVAVISAQAEPMVRPYYQNANQLSGFISSLSGGAAYETTTGKPKLVRTYWDAFNVGLILAIGVILIGGAINVSSVLITRSEETEQTEGEAT